MSFVNIMSFLGGVGLFLYGMTVMSAGLRNAAGDKLRVILEKVAGNRILAILIGVLVTVLIQSSSATDMMVIGFVDSALMTLSQAVGVIMGANIGTTVTAQITAFDLVSFAPFILFVGVVLAVFVKKTFVQHIGRIIKLIPGIMNKHRHTRLRRNLRILINRRIPQKYSMSHLIDQIFAFPILVCITDTGDDLVSSSFTILNSTFKRR